MADQGTDSFIQLKDGDWGNLNRALRYIYAQLDAITGRRGMGTTPHQRYTPKLTNFVNLDWPPVPLETNYVRVLDTVLVYGEVTQVNPNVGATPTSFEMSLPIPPKFLKDYQGAGVAFCPTAAGMGTSILGSVANQTAIFQWESGTGANVTLTFMFIYSVN